MYSKILDYFSILNKKITQIDEKCSVLLKNLEKIKEYFLKTRYSFSLEKNKQNFNKNPDQKKCWFS